MKLKHKLALVVFFTAVALFLAGSIYFGVGRGASHEEGVDYSNYMGWWFVATSILLSAFAGALLLKTYVFKGKGGSILVLIMTILLLFPCSQVFSALRSFANNAHAEDITISSATSGDFIMLDAQAMSYTSIDKGGFWEFPFRIMTLEENYKLVFDINATQNYTLYNSTTATLTAYNVNDEAIVSAYSPVSQPGDFTTSSGAIQVTFKDIPQRLDSPNKVTTYYNLSLYDDYDSDGTDELLASWIVHTSPLIKDWSVDTTV